MLAVIACGFWHLRWTIQEDRRRQIRDDQIQNMVNTFSPGNVVPDLPGAIQSTVFPRDIETWQFVYRNRLYIVNKSDRKLIRIEPYSY